MKDTGFLPPAAARARVAPTEKCTPYGWPCEGPDMQMLRGTVHDPTARRMGGVAGHAGLFSTAADLSIFCRMLLNGGSYKGARILAPLTVAKMTTPASAPGDPNVRGLGWDMDSSFSSNRGELLPLGSFGHTGFTGTSIWIDPATRAFVVFMSNRVHPDGKGDVTPLRARVATIAASALTDAPAEAARGRLMTGRDFGASGTPQARPQAGAGPERARRPARPGLRAVPRQEGRPRDQPHGSRPRRRNRHRPVLHREGRETRRALQSRARHSRRARRRRSRRSRCEDEAADSLALRRHPAPDCRDARGTRRDRDRSAGHRRPHLHLSDDDGVRDGGGGEDQAARYSCSIGRTR